MITPNLEPECLRDGGHPRGQRIFDFVDNIQWDGNAATAKSFIGERYGVDWEYQGNGPAIVIPPSGVVARPGDWITKDGYGEFGVLKIEEDPT